MYLFSSFLEQFCTHTFVETDQQQLDVLSSDAWFTHTKSCSFLQWSKSIIANYSKTKGRVTDTAKRRFVTNDSKLFKIWHLWKLTSACLSSIAIDDSTNFNPISSISRQTAACIRPQCVGAPSRLGFEASGGHCTLVVAIGCTLVNIWNPKTGNF